MQSQKLHKTDMPGFYYSETKKGITYYYNYKDKATKQSKRKKIYSCKEHNSKNLTYAISIKDEVLNEENIKLVLKETNDNMNEDFNLEHLTLNEIIDIHQEKYYQRKVRELKEYHAGYSEEEFNRNAVVKKKLYAVKRRMLQYNKNIRNSSIGQMKYNKLRRRHINNFLETELNQNLALKTKYNIMTFIRAAINSMRRNEYILIDNIFEKIEIQNDKRQRTRVLTPDEIELLLKECKKYNKPQKKMVYPKGKTTKENWEPYEIVVKPNYNIYMSVYLGVITAGRSSTVLTIRKKDINLKQGIITLINHKAKGRKYDIPLNKTAIKWFEKILEYYKDDEYLIRPQNDYQQKRIGKNNSMTFIPRKVFEIMDELFNKNWDKNKNLHRDNVCNYHTIRRSILTNLYLSKRVTMYSLKILANHVSIDTTQAYINSSYLDFQEELAVFQNEIFKGFNNLSDYKEDGYENYGNVSNSKIENKNNNISDLKNKLIQEILKKSGNENNEMVKVSLESFTEDALKKKLITYI